MEIKIINKQEWLEYYKGFAEDSLHYQCSPEYIDFLEMQGYVYVLFSLGQTASEGLGIAYILKARVGNLLVVPRSIYTSQQLTEQTTQELFTFLREIAHKNTCYAIRLALDNATQQYTSLPHSFHYIALEDTVALDIRQDLSIIKKSMRDATLRKIKKFEKMIGSHELHYTIGTELPPEAYTLYAQSAQEKKFRGLPYSFMCSELKAFGARNQAFVITVFQHQDILSWGVFLLHNTHCYYRHGANKRGDLPTSYGVQILAIQEAKKRGAYTYDFMGAAPEGSNPDHPWYGITQFKKGFGAHHNHLGENKDIIVRPFQYEVAKLIHMCKKLLGR